MRRAEVDRNTGDMLENLTRRGFEDDWRRASERNVLGMPASMKAVADFAPSLMKSMFDDRAPDLRDAPSSASLQWDAAIEHFRSRRLAAGFSLQRVERDTICLARSCDRLRGVCESPIEYQIAPWLLCQHYGDWPCGYPTTHLPKEDACPPDAELMLVPQFAFARFRVDFALVAKLAGQLKIVAVECDGEDYHQDRNRDFRRDAYLKGWNIETVRASGSEIARNPEAVARRVAVAVIDWACSLGLRP